MKTLSRWVNGKNGDPPRRRYNWRKIKTGTLGDLRPPLKKAVRTSLRFTRLNEDAYIAQSTVDRDNEDLRAKVSQDFRGVYVYSRGTKPKNKTGRGAAEKQRTATCMT